MPSEEEWIFFEAKPRISDKHLSLHTDKIESLECLS